MIAQGKRAHTLVDKANDTQGVLDAFPDLGLSPVMALSVYNVLRNALIQLGGQGVPEFSEENYEIDQENGRVIYTAPSVEDVEEEYIGE